ncbi:phospholipid-binding lipoprotein MlaA [Prosthecobacter fusiformis]|uniref:Phospholipid-binding lipoprotein MlaA n=1 Tax=Prosthecobacter fusiformis TaxID=48464 RepID=A0A4R7SRU3_9BACT|nr:VacJ family lipoprotein [Prosthecobacter fusiformis]TDU80897.1 phospholipid-binding lipoprotein MlaA [Prosthecobacter fusiformis]
MKPGSTTLRLLFLSVIPFLTDCATKSQPAPPADAPVVDAADAVDELDDYGATVAVSDPLEGLNRATFKLNDGIYNFVFRPVAKGYEFVAPTPVRKGLGNFFDNVKFPIRFVNSGLQGKFGRAGKEAQKFGVNTIAGFGGFIRQSDKIPALTAVPKEDTGQTFGRWGVGTGPYLVLPILGPSNLRDAVGYAGDYVLNPTHWGLFMKGDTNDWAWIPGTVDTIQSSPDLLYYYDESCKNSVDPYLSVRSTYMQNRDAAVKE